MFLYFRGLEGNHGGNVMAKDGGAFEKWLKGASIPERRLSPEQRSVLQATFAFLENCGRDYTSLRIVGHFLLHCQLGLKKAQVARLLNVTPPTVWRQSKLSSREVVREIQHRLSGRPYGKLLPRYAGPVAEFLLTHPEASRSDVLDFIERTWQIQVSVTALHNFLKTYGLDRASRVAATTAAEPAAADPATSEQALIEVLGEPPAPGRPLSALPQDFFLATPSTPVPSCYSPKCSAGGKSRNSASRMSTARCSGAS
jgi:hypothetical protein